MDLAFWYACENGYLKLAQVLLYVNPNIDISAQNEVAFWYACENGHLKVAQWLLTVKPDIDISRDGEEVFRWACRNGHIEVAQWLLTVKPNINISVFSECAFRWACTKGHIEVAQWLQKLKPYFYVIKNIKYKKNNEIFIDFYIRTNKEEKWEKKKYGLWLQSDNTNIIGALPIDISKTILSY